MIEFTVGMVWDAFVLVTGTGHPDAHLVLFTASGAALLGTFSHELGHYLTSKAFGIRKAPWVLFPCRRLERRPGITGFLTRYAALAAVDLGSADLKRLAVWQRRCVFLAGCAADILVALVVLSIWPDFWNGTAYSHGAVLGVVLRVAAGLPVNLMPNALVRNDGWRFLHPEQLDW